MNPQRAEQPGRTWAPWAAGWGPVAVFIALITLARIVYLVWFCPYTLAEDEAHYWEWSRHLAWSYYSKGPGVAWVIAASTAAFGNVEWAVRLPAVIASAIGSMAVADVALRISDDRRSAFAAAVLYQCVPPFAILSTLMTIDGPFLACWAVACSCAVRAMQDRSRLWLVGAGLALGVGFVFKYTIVLLAAGLLGAFFAERRSCRLGAGALCAAAGAMTLGLVPVLIWNAQHDWVTVRHLLGHLGLPGGDLPSTQATGGWRYDPLWTLEYVGMLLIAGPSIVLGPIVAIRRWSRSVGVRVLAWASLPVLVFYLLVSLLARTEGNWPLGGFVGLVPLSAAVIPQAIDRGIRPIRACWRLAVGAGVVTVAGFVFLPALAEVPRLGQLVPVQRLTGMRVLAAAASQRLGDLQDRTGLEPFLMSQHYGRASQLAFYMPGHPVVYCAGSLNPGARRSQYDLWARTDLRRPEVNEALRGRPALLFGGEAQFWQTAFDRIEDVGPLPGEPKRNRTTYEGLGYRGFDTTQESEGP